MKRFFALILVLIFIQPLRADTSGGDVEGTKVETPKAPEVTNYQPGKPMDRQKSQAAAKAMQVLSSGQSMMACMQMMQAAQKASGSDKALMMMMAQQSCQQGKESAKAADENDKGMKLVSAEDIPKQSQLKINEQKVPSGSPKEDTSAMASYQVFDKGDAKKMDEKSGATASDDVPVLNPILPKLNLGDDKKTADRAVAGETQAATETKQAPDLPKIAPEVIKGSTVTMDGDKKNGDGILPNLGPNLNSFGPNIAGNGKSPAEEAKTAKAVPEEGETRKKSEPVGSGEGAGGGGSSGGESVGTGDKGPDPFEAMLAQIMGGPPPEEGGGGAGDGVVLEQRRTETKPPNLFEYATFRYLKLVDAKKLRNRPAPTPLDKPAIPGDNAVAKAPKLSKR